MHPSRDQRRRQNRCSVCGEVGHNRRNCPRIEDPRNMQVNPRPACAQNKPQNRPLIEGAIREENREINNQNDSDDTMVVSSHSN